MKVFCTAEESSGGDTFFQCPVVGAFSLTTDSHGNDGQKLRKHLLQKALTASRCIDGGTKNNEPRKSETCVFTTSTTYSDSSNCKKQYVDRQTNGIIESKTCLSARMHELMKGLNEPGDSGNPPEPPEWLNWQLFNQGKQFYERYLFCIFFSDLLSLIMMFSINRILRPLIYTGRSDTPFRAFRRYYSTIMHIIVWYTGDVWDPQDNAHKDLLAVRSIHNKAAAVFNSSTDYDKVREVTVKGKGHLELTCPLSPSIQQDLSHQTQPGIEMESENNPPFYISQWDMLITQYSFLGVMVAHPHSMGAWRVSDNELAGLIHFWRGIGWLLGVKDEYNFCNGTVSETKALCQEMEQLVMIPNLSVVDLNHEHMSSALIDGINKMVPGLSYPPMFRFLADTLGLSIPKFIAQMTFKHTLQYWLMRFVFHGLFIIPGTITIFNELLKFALSLVQNQHPSWFPKSTQSQVKVTPYIYT